MLRLVLLLLGMAAVAVLLLSNLVPVPLVILGIQFQALPLGVWIIGSIAAGALTTLLISGLFGFARLTAPSRPRSSQRFTANRNSNSPRTPWTSWTQRQASSSSSSSKTYAARSDDWETNPSAKEEWDDWEEGTSADRAYQASQYQPPQYREPQYQSSRYQSQENIRDTSDDDWANWEGYEGYNNLRRPEREDFEEDDRLSDAPRQPRRTDFEVKQEPETRQQSGSIYSYSYRKSTEAEEPPVSNTPPVAKPGEVYDAEYRVITPPYRPDSVDTSPPYYSDPTPPPSTAASDSERASAIDDDEDWGLDDDFDNDDCDSKGGDRPRPA